MDLDTVTYGNNPDQPVIAAGDLVWFRGVRCNYKARVLELAPNGDVHIRLTAHDPYGYPRRADLWTSSLWLSPRTP
jgi:hypothetical protein